MSNYISDDEIDIEIPRTKFKKSDDKIKKYDIISEDEYSEDDLETLKPIKRINQDNSRDELVKFNTKSKKIQDIREKLKIIEKENILTERLNRIDKELITKRYHDRRNIVENNKNQLLDKIKDLIISQKKLLNQEFKNNDYEYENEFVIQDDGYLDKLSDKVFDFEYNANFTDDDYLNCISSDDSDKDDSDKDDSDKDDSDKDDSDKDDSDKDDSDKDDSDKDDSDKDDSDKLVKNLNKLYNYIDSSSNNLEDKTEIIYDKILGFFYKKYSYSSNKDFLCYCEEESKDVLSEDFRDDIERLIKRLFIKEFGILSIQMKRRVFNIYQFICKKLEYYTTSSNSRSIYHSIGYVLEEDYLNSEKLIEFQNLDKQEVLNKIKEYRKK